VTLATIKKGTRVIVVEGADQGEKGIVTSIFRRYDEDDRATRKMVSFENETGHRITTRLAWVREL
jgi:ribosomal protein L24